MALKDEAKDIILGLFGPSSAEKVESLDDSEPLIFLENVRKMISDILGESIAKNKLEPLYSKYGKPGNI